jgi:sn-glycerol 3-phosphate transport system substrate-binding protein
MLLCLVLLAACGGEDSGPGTDSGSNASSSWEGVDLSAYVYQKPEEMVEITFWTSAIEEINQLLVDQFNETKGAELNIHVSAVYQGDYWETLDKINASSIAGTLPNVFIDEVAMAKGFAEDGVILNLEPYIRAKDFDAAAFQIGDLGNLYVNGDMYAFPHMRSVPVMYVNQTLAKKAKVNENGPATFDELEAYLKACHEVTGQPAMYIFHQDFWIMETLLYSYGGGTMTLNEDETACNINGESGAALITFLRGLVDKGYAAVIPMTDINAFYGTLTDPNTALWFTTIAGYKLIAGMAAQSGMELGVAMIPTGKDGTRGVPVGGSNTYLCDTGTALEKAAGFEFMAWLSDTDQAAFASANTGYLPTKLASLETDLMKETMAQFPGYAVAFDQLRYCIMRPTTAVYREVQDLLCEKVYTILTAADVDIPASLNALAADVNRILNRS